MQIFDRVSSMLESEEREMSQQNSRNQIRIEIQRQDFNREETSDHFSIRDILDNIRQHIDNIEINRRRNNNNAQP